ncbi:MAG: TRAP transporter permease, partial [Candidatus Thiodiazotropha endolucinida]
MLYEKLHKIEQIMFDALALGLVLFYSYSAVLEPAATQYHRGIYIIITYMLVFMLYRTPTVWGRVWDYILIAASIGSIGYWIVNF